MARYFFHIKDGAELEGTELPTPHAARLQALASARELWADAIKSGEALGADAVVIADEYGGTLFVPMKHSLAPGTWEALVSWPIPGPFPWNQTALATLTWWRFWATLGQARGASARGAAR